jgi:hypothetical protein
MSDWAAAEADFLAGLAQRPAAKPPATLGEIWRDSFAGAGMDTITDIAGLGNEAFRELEGAVGSETGQTLRDFTDNWNGSGFSDWSPTEQAAMVADRLHRLDKDGRDRIAPLIDIAGRASQKAQAIEERAAETWSRTYGLSGIAVSYLAGMARQMLEPLNLAGIAAGGPTRGPVLTMLAREAAIGGGIQALQEPGIELARSGVGLDAGVTRGAVNVATAAIGSAGFSALLRGVSAGARLAFRGRRPAGEGPAHAPAAADFEAAAMVAERNEVLDAQAAPPTQRGRAEAAERIDAAAAAMERGRFDGSSPLDASRSPPVSAAIYGPPRPDPTLTFQPERIAYFDGDRQQIIRPGGRRLDVRPAVMELSDITVSHTLDGAPNPNYQTALQPRDRSSAASRSFVAAGAAELEPELLGLSPTAATGAPVIGPDALVESGNGRIMMIARAYDRHPERAAAYRAQLEGMGYDLAGFKHPVLVRIREGEIEDRAAFAREANVSPVAGLSVRERAFADGANVDDTLMQLWQGGETASLANVRFVRAFADRVVAPEERPQFIDADNRLSADGRARIEAALVARAWGAEDIVSALYEAADPTSKAILGAFADTAPLAARVKTAIAEGRIAAADDPAPAMLEAFRIIDRARAAGQKPRLLLDQIDIEKGAVPDDVRAAARLFFRDDDLAIPAGRDIVAEKIQNAMNRAIDKQNAIADLFAARADVDANLRAAKLAGETIDDQPLPEVKAPAIAPDDDVAAAPAQLLDGFSAEEKAAMAATRTEADRVLEEAGGDFDIFLPGDDGEFRRVSAKVAIAEADEQAAAAAELSDCIVRVAAEAA